MYLEKAVQKMSSAFLFALIGIFSIALLLFFFSSIPKAEAYLDILPQEDSLMYDGEYFRWKSISNVDDVYHLYWFTGEVLSQSEFQNRLNSSQYMPAHCYFSAYDSNGCFDDIHFKDGYGGSSSVKTRGEFETQSLYSVGLVIQDFDGGRSQVSNLVTRGASAPPIEDFRKISTNDSSHVYEWTAPSKSVKAYNVVFYTNEILSWYEIESRYSVPENEASGGCRFSFTYGVPSHCGFSVIATNGGRTHRVTLDDHFGYDTSSVVIYYVSQDGVRSAISNILNPEAQEESLNFTYEGNADGERFSWTVTDDNVSSFSMYYFSGEVLSSMDFKNKIERGDPVVRCDIRADDYPTGYNCFTSSSFSYSQYKLEKGASVGVTLDRNLAHTSIVLGYVTDNYSGTAMTHMLYDNLLNVPSDPVKTIDDFYFDGSRFIWSSPESDIEEYRIVYYTNQLLPKGVFRSDVYWNKDYGRCYATITGYDDTSFCKGVLTTNLAAGGLNTYTAIPPLQYATTMGIIYKDHNGRMSKVGNVITYLDGVYRSHRFYDVPYDSWYNQYVSKLYSTGIISGDAYSNTFRPGGYVNRAEAVKMLLLSTNIDPVKVNYHGVNDFCDVGDADWFTPYVKYVGSSAMVEGYPDSSCFTGKAFRPGQNLTRAEAAKLLFEISHTNIDLSVQYSDRKFYDVSPYDWYTPYVHAAFEYGLMQGYSDGTFKPNAPINRAEMAKVISLLIDKL